MRDLETEGVVLSDTLNREEVRNRSGVLEAVEMRGRIQCAGGLTVNVEKVLEARARPDGRPEVRGFSYRYHAWCEYEGVQRDLNRYDSAHGGLDGLHRHVFDPRTGRARQRDPIPLADLPTLDQVLIEAVEWRCAALPEARP